MSFSVQDLLDLPLMRTARPEVMNGDELHVRSVRWVHTSEIYDISPLLKGGEVLFTTGLGLIGVSAEGIGHYVAALARQNVSALAFELGRTFTKAPDALTEAAERHAFPLILLHGVVPFIEITETVHTILIAEEVTQLRRLNSASMRLNETLLAGLGIKPLMETARRVCDVPLGLYSPSGDLLAGEPVVEAGGMNGQLVEFEIGSGPWAVLAARVRDLPGTREVLEMSATSIGICLSQTSQVSPNRRLAGADLLRDIATGRYLSSAELTSRATAVGFAVREENKAVGIVIDLTTLLSSRSGFIATDEAARKTFGPCLVAEHDGHILAAVALSAVELRERLHDFARAIDDELGATTGGNLVRLTAGPLVDDVAGLTRSIPAACAASQLASQLTLATRVLLASDLGAYQLLSRVVADTELERFVEEQLGPLLEHDARSGADLTLTLDAYLQNGLSKTAASTALGIRRQTLYNRLERISGLLGGLDFADRQRLTALDLALTTWRMRTSGVVRAG